VVKAGRLSGRLVGQLGQQPSESGQAFGRCSEQLVIVGFGGEPAQGRDQRHIGQADVTDLQAPTNQDLHASPAGLLGELGQQPGLPHPGVTRHQHHGRSALLALLQGA
jgi:hypothetical protein